LPDGSPKKVSHQTTQQNKVGVNQNNASFFLKEQQQRKHAGESCTATREHMASQFQKNTKKKPTVRTCAPLQDLYATIDLRANQLKEHDSTCFFNKCRARLLEISSCNQQKIDD
jgi:hypothetical protein